MSDEKIEKLNKIYTSSGSEAAYTGGAKVLRIAFNKQYPDEPITLKYVQNFLDKKETYSLHKNARRKYPRNPVYVATPGDMYCCDLMDFPDLKRKNKGYRYILLVLDCFTRYAYAEGMKTKKATESLEAFKKIIRRSEFVPTVLISDYGSEFINKSWEGYLKYKGIKFLLSQGDTKGHICERAIRTIKEKLYRFFDDNMTRDWISNLQAIVTSYNTQHHSSLGVAPVDVTIDNYPSVYRKLYGKIPKRKKNKLKKDDLVRLNRPIKWTDKSYENRWSRALYRVIKGPIYPRMGPFPMYKIAEIDTDKELPGTYYEDELLLVDKKVFYDDYIFPIEKKLRTRIKNGRKEVLVKWLGYDTKQWVDFNTLKKAKPV